MCRWPAERVGRRKSPAKYSTSIPRFSEGDRMNQCRRVFLLFSLVALFSTLAQAQYRGSLHGTVTDPQGAAISGANVTLLNTATNQKTVSTTDANGIYHFNALPPNVFKLTVNATGFKQN